MAEVTSLEQRGRRASPMATGECDLDPHSSFRAKNKM